MERSMARTVPIIVVAIGKVEIRQRTVWSVLSWSNCLGIMNIDYPNATPTKIGRFWIVVFAFCDLCIGCSWFVIGSRWLNNAWEWLSKLLSTFLEIIKCRPNLERWTPYVLQRYFRHIENTESVCNFGILYVSWLFISWTYLLAFWLFGNFNFWKFEILENEILDFLDFESLELWNFETLELSNFETLILLGYMIPIIYNWINHQLIDY